MEVNFEAGDVNSKLERYSFFFCIPSSNDMVVKIKGENVTFIIRHLGPGGGIHYIHDIHFIHNNFSNNYIFHIRSFSFYVN